MNINKIYKETIINSIDIEDNIKNDIIKMLEEIWLYSFTVSGNNRSTLKTNVLHTHWENILINAFGDYKNNFINNFNITVEKEEAYTKKTNRIKDIIDIFGNKFKVDMLMSHKDEINTVFLLKAPLTSINKNRYNSVLNNFGEIDRFYGNKDNEHIELIFVNITPKETFIINNKQKTIMHEKVQYLGLNRDDKGEKPIDKLPKREDIKDKVHEIHIEYNINFEEELKNIITKRELKRQIKNAHNFITLNDEDLIELKNYIQHFINKNNSILNDNLKDKTIINKNSKKLKF